MSRSQFGDMDRESLLKNSEISLCLCRVLVGSLQRRNGLTLTVEAALRPLNAQLRILKVLLQCEAAGPSRSLAVRINARAVFLPVDSF